MQHNQDDKGYTIMGFISLGNLCYRNLEATRAVLEVGVLEQVEARMVSEPNARDAMTRFD